MTHLTSEQYRSVLKCIPKCTEEIPNVQTLLRRAVQTFFKRFRGYPKMAGVAPGKIGLLGDQTQFNDGFALPVATPMATIIVGRQVPGNRFTVVTSADVGKPHKVTFSFSRNRPLGPGCPTWLNYIKCAIDSYPETVPPFEAAIESSIPMGVGFGSSAALEVAVNSFIEVLVGKKTETKAKLDALQKAEKEFFGRDVKLVDVLTSILAKDRQALKVDCETKEVTWIPFRNSKVTLVAVNLDLKDELLGDEYPERAKYLAKAAELLKVENLRNCTEEHLEQLENIVNDILAEKEEEDEEEERGEDGEGWEGPNSEGESWTKEDWGIMMKRARFFITEMIRIKEAIEAWDLGDVATFGEKLKESHKSLKEDFDFSNPVLEFLMETSLEVEGVLGSRMTGMGLGFGGGIISVVNKANVETYCNYITEKFMEYEDKLNADMKEIRQEAKHRLYEIRKKFHSEHFNPSIASSEKIGRVQQYLESGGVMKKSQRRRTTVESGKKGSFEGKEYAEKKKIPCIVKVEKPQGGCGTWASFQKSRDKEEFLRKLSIMKEEQLKKNGSISGYGRRYGNLDGNLDGNLERNLVENSTEEFDGEALNSRMMTSMESKVSTVALANPNFYIISPFAGARMLFVTKADMLRSRYSQPVPHTKALVQSAKVEFETTFGTKVEAISLAPGSFCLFGEFMDFHLGYIITMTVPMYVAVVGGRNDSVFFSVKTTSKDVERPQEMKYPLPSVRPIEMESRSWSNYVMGSVSEFKAHVPGFNAVIHSSVPINMAMNSCGALQASIYTFLENLTGEHTTNVLDKVEECRKNENVFPPEATELASHCCAMKFFPIFSCKEGHLMLINCKNYKISNYFFDDPNYVFLIAACKQNTTDVTVSSLDERLKQCEEAIEILNRKSLLFLDLKHLKCLKKRDAPDEVIKRAKYVITEHQRTLEAIKAIKEEDYPRVGLIMNQSHASLRDDYEVSSPQIEDLIKLALSASGVLGAKMLGAGLTATIIILIKLSDADKCIRYMRKNYRNKSDKPVFYITKPAGCAFAMNPTEVSYIL